MKKYTKLMGLLLSSTCFVGVSLSYAAEPETPNQLQLASRDSSRPLTVVKIEGGTGHEVALRVADQAIKDPEGRSYRYSMMTVDGARVDRLERGHNDAPHLQAGAKIRHLLDAAKRVEGSDMDSRDKAESECDQSLVKVYYEFKTLQEGLLSLKNGYISQKLMDLTKALSLLHLDSNSTISKVNDPLVELIEIVRAAAGKLRGSLQEDMGNILEVTGVIVGDCEEYIKDRIGPVDGLTFEDILPPQDELEMAEGKNNTLFAIERVNIKRISKMLLEVRKTFGAVKDGTFGRNRHWKIKTFLDNVAKLDPKKLKDPESHSYQIKEYADLFDNKETILNGLNKKLESNANKELTVFCDGIGQINILLETLMEYFDSASAVARAGLAKDLMALPESQRKDAIAAIGKREAVSGHELISPPAMLSIEAAPVHRPLPAEKQGHHPVPKAASPSHAYSGGSTSTYPSSAHFEEPSSESYHEPMASSYSDEDDYDSAPPVPADEEEGEATGISSSHQASTSHISPSPYAAPHHAVSHQALARRAEPKAQSHGGSAQLEPWQDNPLSSRLEKAAKDLQAKAERANKDAGHMVYSAPRPAEDEPFYESDGNLLYSSGQLESAKVLFVARGDVVLDKIETAKVFIQTLGENIHEIIAERERIKEQERRHREFEKRLEDDRIQREAERLRKEYGDQADLLSKFGKDKK